MESAPELKNETRTELEHAYQTAPLEIELEQINDQQDSLTRSFLEGKISGSVFKTEMNKLDVQAGTIKIKDLSGFLNLLRAFLPKETVERIAAHENAHMSKALSLGLDPVYQIQFSRPIEKDSSLNVHPAISLDLPVEMPDEEKRLVLKLILEAPEDPSPRDRNKTASS